MDGNRAYPSSNQPLLAVARNCQELLRRPTANCAEPNFFPIRRPSDTACRTETGCENLCRAFRVTNNKGADGCRWRMINEGNRLPVG